MDKYNIIKVNASHQYDVMVCNGMLPELGNVMSKLFDRCSIAILTDDIVDALYADAVIKSLKANGFRCIKHTIPNGESSKNMDSVLSFINFMASEQITRSDMVLALGGGVIGDMAGFASAIYLRGIKYIQVPTTLLAAVDSSVGGKTAVDISAGKNLIGAFHQPALVFCDISTLNTLPANIMRDGFAEVIKYGIILDKALYNKLLKKDSALLEQIISRCIEIKRDVVAADEFDKGERQLLNFGHTIGHSIELLSNFTITHGEAVAKGMVIAAKLGKECGYADVVEPIKNIVEMYGFDTNCPYSATDLYRVALSDKKRNRDNITVVLPESIGKCVLHTISTEELHNLLNRIKL